jgi:hypothetical protein
MGADGQQGLKYPPEVIKQIEDKAALKMATDLVDCASAYVMLAKNTSMTGQKIQVGELPRRVLVTACRDADLNRCRASYFVSVIARESVVGVYILFDGGGRHSAVW